MPFNVEFCNNNRDRKVIIKNFKSTNYNLISDYLCYSLQDISWDLPSEEIWQKFIFCVKRSIELFVHSYTLVTHNDKVLSSRGTFLYKKMHRAYQKWIMSEDNAYYIKYKSLKNLYRKSLVKNGSNLKTKFLILKIIENVMSM